MVDITIVCVLYFFLDSASGSSIQSCSISRLLLAHLIMSMLLEILCLMFGVQTDNHFECFFKCQRKRVVWELVDNGHGGSPLYNTVYEHLPQTNTI